MERDPPVVTLTTDFGTSDGYVGAMKGIMLGINPRLILTDISHEVQPFDLVGAAFLLQQSFKYFPTNTVHLVVVDPGVGSARRAVALHHEGHYFVGPDNGLFTLVLNTDTPEKIVTLEPDDDPRLSMTFHGRDLFAPTAARLASGTHLEALGSILSHLHPMDWNQPTCHHHEITGEVVYIDHFGNCITNISRDLIEKYAKQKTVTGSIGHTTLHHVYSTYSDVPQGEILMLYGSTYNLLEIAIHQGNAASHLNIQRHTPVHLTFGP